MDSLEEIKILVQKKVNQNSSKVILSYFQELINKHEDFCGCNYCNILSKYVSLKKYKSSFNRRYGKYEYEHGGVLDIKLEQEFVNNYRTIESKIKELKLEKNRLKILN